ncbi:MAG: dual specificity protein phosphatase family protein [Candidatus Hodarchaeota archaeon]
MLIPELDQIYEVYTNLYIGAYWPRLNFKKFKEIGITAIVNLMEESLYNPTSLGFSYLHKGFPDNTYPPHEFLNEILGFIEMHLENNGKVLIHCSMGVSRSGGLVVAWLLKKNPTWSWRDAISYVSKSKFIAPAVEIRESILDYLESFENSRRNY